MVHFMIHRMCHVAVVLHDISVPPLKKRTRVIRGCYNPILSPPYGVVEQQLLIPVFLPEFLETSGDQENLRFLEEVAGPGD